MAQKRYDLSLGKTEAVHVLEAIESTVQRQRAMQGITNSTLEKVATRLKAALEPAAEPTKKEPEDADAPEA